MLLLAACSAAPQSSVPPPAPTSTTVAATTTVATSSTLPPATACPEGDLMLTDGQLVDWERPGADSSRIAGISWRTVGACHVVTISFATDDGAPATTPPTLTARILRDTGVLRVDSETTSSVIVDQLVEDGLIERMFVPIDSAGNRFIDFVLSGPAVGRARLMTSPARLEIELQPGGPPEVGSPLVTENVVVVEPGLGATVGPIIDLSGYSTAAAESLNLSVLRDGAPIEEATVELASQPGTWTGFTFNIQLGDRIYDSLRISSADGSVLAGIPFSP